MNNEHGNATDDWGGLAIFLVGIAVVGAIIGVLGWRIIISGVLWIAVVAAALGALFCAGTASDTTDDKAKTKYWLASGACAILGFLVWVCIPPGASDAVDSATVASNSDGESLSPKGQRTLEYWRGLRTAWSNAIPPAEHYTGASSRVAGS